MDDRATFPAELSSVTRARHWAAHWCTVHGHQSRIDAVGLIISELVANAVIHGTGAIDVSLAGTDARLRGSVRDHDPTPFFHQSQDDVGGWGLSIVANLTESWHVDYDATGKSVHFELGPLPD